MDCCACVMVGEDSAWSNGAEVFPEAVMAAGWLQWGVSGDRVC